MDNISSHGLKYDDINNCIREEYKKEHEEKNKKKLRAKYKTEFDESNIPNIAIQNNIVSNPDYNPIELGIYVI